ncbi:MAG TPA: hypothetical protein VF278_10630 [Pirellulales bacterium]
MTNRDSRQPKSWSREMNQIVVDRRLAEAIRAGRRGIQVVMGRMLGATQLAS